MKVYKLYEFGSKLIPIQLELPDTPRVGDTVATVGGMLWKVLAVQFENLNPRITLVVEVMKTPK